MSKSLTARARRALRRRWNVLRRLNTRLSRQLERRRGIRIGSALPWSRPAGLLSWPTWAAWIAVCEEQRPTRQGSFFAEVLLPQRDPRKTLRGAPDRPHPSKCPCPRCEVTNDRIIADFLRREHGNTLRRALEHVAHGSRMAYYARERPTRLRVVEAVAIARG